MNIEKLLDDSLIKEREERKSRVRSGKMNPSSFGQCFRRQYYNRSNTPESNPIPIETLRVFKAGSLFHDLIQNLLPPHQKEVEITTDEIHGFADIVTDDMVIDIKSQNQFAFKAMAKPGYKIEEEKVDYILQLMTYVFLLGKKIGKLVFINKDNLEIRKFEFHIDDWINKVNEEGVINSKYWLQKTLPPPEPRLYKGKECSYCSWENTCKGKAF